MHNNETGADAKIAWAKVKALKSGGDHWIGEIKTTKRCFTRWPIRLMAVPTVTHSRACIPPSTNMLDQLSIRKIIRESGGRIILSPWSELPRSSSTDLDHPDCSALVARTQLDQVVHVEDEDDGGECEDGDDEK